MGTHNRTPTLSYGDKMRFKRSHVKKGQVAQVALMSIAIYTAFILILLSALINTLPQIQQHQEKQMQKQINLYRCTTIDNLAALNSSGIKYITNLTNLHCMSITEDAIGRPRYRNFEKRALD